LVPISLSPTKLGGSAFVRALTAGRLRIPLTSATLPIGWNAGTKASFGSTMQARSGLDSGLNSFQAVGSLALPNMTGKVDNDQAGSDGEEG